MEKIIKLFGIEKSGMKVRSLHVGHINDSFVVEIEEGHRLFLLQRINHNIFKDIEGLQNNIKLVTDHLRKKYKESGVSDTSDKVLQLVETPKGKTYVSDGDGNFWRMYVFIQKARSFDQINTHLARKAGKAYGNFHKMLADLPANNLIETIPNFHNMEFRLKEFRLSVQANKAGRVKEVSSLIEQVESRAEEMCLPQRLFRAGKLPKRITHCDTKVNNLLFDENEDPICIVDMDTVMPGFVMSDFGDFMRTAANTAKEDESDLNKVNFNLLVFRAFSEAYIAETRHFLDAAELQLLPFGAKLLTYMQFVRFLTDYINGDIYYKTKYEEHNLVRSRAQLRLLEDIENNYSEMNLYIKQLCN